MKIFIGFVKKEFLHIFRDVRTLIILFGIPASQIFIFGYAVSTDIQNAGIAVLDLSNDEITTEITSRIESSDFFVLKERLQSEKEIDEAFKKGVIRQVIIFENGFGERLQKEGVADLLIIADGSEPNVANLVTGYTKSIISTWVSENSNIQNSGIMSIEPEVKMYYNPNLESQFMFVPGTITIILVLVCALMTSITITREKENGTMEVLLVSPLRPIHIILGKVAPYLLLSLLVMLVILFLSWIVFHLPVQGSMVLLLLETILYIVLALSLGIMISTLSKTTQQAMFISLLGLMMPTILLSGFIFPIEYMPEVYNYLSMIIPPRWFIVILKNILIKGTGLAFIWKETLILFGMTIFLIAFSVKNFKVRQQ